MSTPSATQQVEDAVKALRTKLSNDQVVGNYIDELNEIDWSNWQRQFVTDLTTSFDNLLLFHAEEIKEPLLGFVVSFPNDYGDDVPIACEEFYWGMGKSDEYYENGPASGNLSALDQATVVISKAQREFDDEEDIDYIKIKNYMWTIIARTIGRAMDEAAQSDEFKKINTAKKFKVYVEEQEGWATDMDEAGLVYSI